MADVVWKDRKRIIFGLPWTFTRYSLTQEKLVIDTGFISRRRTKSACTAYWTFRCSVR